MSEQRPAVIRRIFLRLVPLLFIAYVTAYLDRVNIGFAALTMNKDIGLSATSYGLGAGMFFIGYFFFEIPSNLLLERFGARRWIARIMVTWGLLSMAMVFVTGPASFLTLRFLIGFAEAGFFPGVILYLTYWFPQAYRARIIAAFMIAIPASLALGAPVSTSILQIGNVAGLSSWQWLFLLEGIPPLVLAVIVLFCLPDRPRNAKWLSDEERGWLEATLEREGRAVEAEHGMTLRRIFTEPRVFALAFIYFADTTANLGLAFFLPQILNALGLTLTETGLFTALPYVVGTIGTLAWGYVSDRMNERRVNLTVALTVAAIGLIGAGLWSHSLIAVAFMSFAAIGIYGAKAPFWPLPSMLLSGTAAAGGIALINALGNLGGFVGPYMVGWIKDETQSFEAGLYMLAAWCLAGAFLTLVVVRPRERAAETVSP
ncbi:MAG TPA: MFS transporter [Aliidongia sp.]|nr:MFS transporter [Aliidongia sp.]